MCIKLDFEEIILKLAAYKQRQKGLSVVIKILSPNMLSAPARGYIHVENMKKRVEIVLKLATNGQSDKGFLLTSTFVSKGLSAPALGLYTCIKALKYIPGPGIRWAFTGPLVLCFFFTFCLLPYCMCANSESSGETVWIPRLAWAFAGRLCDKYNNLMSWLK